MTCRPVMVWVPGLFLSCSALGAENAAPHSPASQAEALPGIRMRIVTISDDFPGAYQVTVADVNRDGRPDVLALGEHPGAVAWFENPEDPRAAWVLHPISTHTTRRNIDLAACDADRDGILDLAVASDFDLSRSDHGVVTFFQGPATPPAHERDWPSVLIHQEPTAHRVRWANIDGQAGRELITVPMTGRGAKLPGLQEAPARILCHWPPAQPTRQPWRGVVVDESLTVVHGVHVVDWNGDRRDDLLTASNQGIHLLESRGEENSIHWFRTRLAAGHVAPPPHCGSSEVCVGRGAGGERFLASIEPWHGHQVVVYHAPPAGPQETALWKRRVIDDSLRAGHALCCTDLDGDGLDEIVAGFRGEGASLYGYRRRANGSEGWERFVIDDGGIAAQGCVAADINRDGRMDLVAAGGRTHNVRLYLNESIPREP